MADSVRHVLYDTESTGLEKTDRIIEVAAVELRNFLPTGRELHFICNPEIPIHPEATKIHGFKDEDVRDLPTFAAFAQELLDFFGDDQRAAHNAYNFDEWMIDQELVRVGLKPLGRKNSLDTLAMWRNRYPTLPGNLDSILDRLGVDRSERVKHGALIDTRLLVRPFVHVMGKDQLLPDSGGQMTARAEDIAAVACQSWFPRRPALSVPQDVQEVHQEFVSRIGASMWANIQDGQPAKAAS